MGHNIQRVIMKHALWAITLLVLILDLTFDWHLRHIVLEGLLVVACIASVVIPSPSG